VMGQKSSLVKGSSFSTIDDSHSFHCGDNSNVSVQKDVQITIGSANYAAAQRWKDAASNIHAVKSLPETQNSGSDGFYSSPLAKKSGENGPCPACSQGRSYKTLKGGNGDEKNNKTIDEGQNSFIDSLKDNFLAFFGKKSKLEIEDAKEEQFPKTENCPVCSGSGKSPSSMGGNFPKEERKEETGNLYLNSAQDFFEAENDLGEGGSLTLNVTKDVFLSVGCASNDFDSVRVNNQGSAHDIGLKLDGENGVYPSPVVGAVVEKVHVDRFPGGQFTVDAQNGINLLGGSGGIDFSSTGVMSIHGTIAEVTGEQVNISAKSGLNIATDDVLSIKGSNISIQSSNQVFVKTVLAVDGNIVCRGGIMAQGEVYLQHVTAPVSFQETEYQAELYGTSYGEKQMVMGFIKNTQTITMDIPGLGNDIPCVVKQTVPIYTTDSGQKAEDGCIFVYPHSHIFRNLPLKLTTTYESTRRRAAGIEVAVSGPIEASKISNGLTCPEVKGTTKEANTGLSNQLKAKEFTPIEL